MFNRTKKAAKKFTVNQANFMKKIIGTEQIADTASWIAQMWKALTHKENGKGETFEEEKIRLQVSEEDIARIRRNYVLNFYIVFLGFLFCLGMLISGIANRNFAGILSSTGIGIALFAYAYKFSIRAYQLKVRERDVLKKWFKNKKEWIAH